MIITRTPLRISISGGGTDMRQFYEKHLGAVVSFAINKHVYVSVNTKFDDAIRVSYSKTENAVQLDDLQHDLARETLREWKVFSGIEIASISDIPGEGTGLGSSSAFTVGLIHALGRGGNPSILAERAYIIEAERCHHPVGKQDQYACAHGGMNYITFRKNRVEVEPLYPHKEFERDMLLLYTGTVRSANDILKEQGENFKKGDTVKVGKQMADMAYRFRCDWMLGKIDAKMLGAYLHEGWQAKKSLATVSNPQIDQWY